jgi:hypothetical protein
MPRKVISTADRPAPVDQSLCRQLVDELRSPHDVGQPLVIEHQFSSTDKKQIQVVWDRFDGIPEQDRSDLILSAFEQVEGKPNRDKILFASGFTVPEAAATGILPFQVVPATSAQAEVGEGPLFKAMKEEGASTVAGTTSLRFPTFEDAETAKVRLDHRLPQGRWLIVQEVIPSS